MPFAVALRSPSGLPHRFCIQTPCGGARAKTKALARAQFQYAAPLIPIIPLPKTAAPSPRHAANSWPSIHPLLTGATAATPAPPTALLLPNGSHGRSGRSAADGRLRHESLAFCRCSGLAFGHSPSITSRLTASARQPDQSNPRCSPALKALTMTRMNWSRARQEAMLSKHGADPVPEARQVIVGPRVHPKNKKARRNRSRGRVKGRCRLCQQYDKDLRSHFAVNHPAEPIELHSEVPPSSVQPSTHLAPPAATRVLPSKPGSPTSRWIDPHGCIRCPKCLTFFAQSELRTHLRTAHDTTPERAYAFIRHDSQIWCCVTTDHPD